MRYSLLLRYLFLVVVTCSISYGVQSCKKEKTTQAPKIIPSAFVASSSCFFYVGALINFSPFYIDSIPLGSTCLWKFGDGTTSIEEMPTHVYSYVDSFVVTLIINNDTVHESRRTIQISQYLMSSYTLQMGGVRLWNGYNARGTDIENVIVDTPLAIQVVDSGTIVFMADTIHLTTIDLITNKVLTYSECEGVSISYYYSTDSIVYNYSGATGIGNDFPWSLLHSP